MKTIAKSSLAAALMAVTVAAQAQGISVTVDGTPVSFKSQEPVVRDARVLVPLRGVFEQLGATVQWNPEQRLVTASQGSRNIRLNIGSTDAKINDRTMTMDVPAEIVNGSTLVPLRFLSEALGANVKWESTNRLVAISTGGGDQSYERPNRMENGRPNKWNRDRNGNGIPDREENQAANTIAANTVIPVKLNNKLSSNGSSAGDKFTATVQTENENFYGGIPKGAYIEGHVADVRAKSGSEPGVIELAFDRIRLPNGRSVAIDGTLYSLDDNAVTRNDDGVLVAKSSSSQNNRAVYAGYGAGAGLILGALTKQPLEKALLGGLLGYVIGTASPSKSNPSNITLAKGKEFGVRLNEQVALTGY